MDAHAVRLISDDEGKTWESIDTVEWPVHHTGTIATMTFCDVAGECITLETNLAVVLGQDVYFNPGEIRLDVCTSNS
jgi:hypothetical protein